MGYSIHIGEAVACGPDEDDGRAESAAARAFLAALPAEAARELAALMLHGSHALADWLEEKGSPCGKEAFWLCVPAQVLPDAPAFPGDDASSRNNGRHPSYSGWHAFHGERGLSAAWGELMPSHPGVAPLRPHHLAAHREALARHRAAFPGATPRQGEGCTEGDSDLARLEWCVWWMQWALANCANPAVSNG